MKACQRCQIVDETITIDICKTCLQEPFLMKEIEKLREENEYLKKEL
jgi:hypothetical protein